MTDTKRFNKDELIGPAVSGPDELSWMDEAGAVMACQFASNEWADLATELPVVLHNVHDGITTVAREVERFNQRAAYCRAVVARAKTVVEAEAAAKAAVDHAIAHGEFEPGQWLLNAQLAIQENPAYVLTLLARLVVLEKSIGDRPVVENEGKGAVAW